MLVTGNTVRLNFPSMMKAQPEPEKAESQKIGLKISRPQNVQTRISITRSRKIRKKRITIGAISTITGRERRAHGHNELH